MANIIRVSVENPDELLNASAYGTGAIIRLQSASASSGPFSNEATAAIVAATRSYTLYDTDGTSTTWYRTRYENAGATVVSDWSDAFLAGQSGYCSLANVKQRLGRTSASDTGDDENFLNLIDLATDYIKGYCQRDFLPDTTTVYTFDGDAVTEGGQCLPIPRGVRSITSLEVAASTGGSFSEVSSSHYVLRPSAQDRTPGWPATEVWLTDVATTSFPSGYDVIRATGTFGFAAVPRRIEEVCLNLVVRMWASRQAGQSDLLGTGGSDGAPMVSSFLSRRDRETLDTFVVHPYGL